MAEKNRVWMRQKDVDDLGQDAGWCNVYSYEPAPPSREVTLVIHDGPSERVYTESEVRAAAMAEPELPGDMPDEMWEACRSDRATMQDAMRVVVRLTRDGILERIGITL